MTNITTELTYEADLELAVELIAKFVDFGAAEGNMRNWAADALNNEWVDGLTIEQWVARAVVRINHGQ